MRRFQISTPNLKSPAEIVYDADGVLCSFSVVGAGMKDQQVFSFKKMIPVKVENLESAFAPHPAITIVEAAFEVSFDMFWNAYDKKINRKRCQQLWDGLNKIKQVKAWSGIANYDRFLKKETWRPKADPDTYLRNEYWENEYK